jgi:hypothetical protein
MLDTYGSEYLSRMHVFQILFLKTFSSYTVLVMLLNSVKITGCKFIGRLPLQSMFCL